MATKKLPNSESSLSDESISSETEFWIGQFQKHLRIAFHDLSQTLLSDASHDDIERITIQAAVETLLDSGVNSDSIVEGVGQAMLERSRQPIVWNETLNQRRVELIDKDLLGEASFTEQVELAKLAAAMRHEFDTEENIPLEGAKALHAKLLKLAAEDKPR